MERSIFFYKARWKEVAQKVAINEENNRENDKNSITDIELFPYLWTFH